MIFLDHEASDRDGSEQRRHSRTPTLARHLLNLTNPDAMIFDWLPPLAVGVIVLCMGYCAALALMLT